MTPEERREWGRLGGLTKGENYRKRREIKSIVEVFAAMPLKKGKVADIETIKNFMEIRGKNVTTMEALGLQLFQKGLKGDLNAVSMILSILGEKPSENVNIDAKVTNNPLKGLTTNELRKLISENDNSD